MKKIKISLFFLNSTASSPFLHVDSCLHEGAHLHCRCRWRCTFYYSTMRHLNTCHVQLFDSSRWSSDSFLSPPWLSSPRHACHAEVSLSTCTYVVCSVEWCGMAPVLSAARLPLSTHSNSLTVDFLLKIGGIESISVDLLQRLMGSIWSKSIFFKDRRERIDLVDLWKRLKSEDLRLKIEDRREGFNRWA